MKILPFTCCLLLLWYCNTAGAQHLQYSRQNVFIENPDDLQLVANISGMHHLLSLSDNRNITIFIFNQHLECIKKLATPFKFPENANLKIISFADFYYLCIYSRPARKYIFWKVDAAGNCTDLSVAFAKLLRTQRPYMESGFQVTEDNGQLSILYHTYIPNLEKNVLTTVLADSQLDITGTKKLMYELKESGEKVLQEKFIDDKYLLLLKSTNSGTGLKLMKVDIATGVVLGHEFFSSGYYFSQPVLTYNSEDSTITISSLLREPNSMFSWRHYVFVSRLNSKLVEEVPFTILKTQFRKNAGTNFLLANSHAGWVRLQASLGGAYFTEVDGITTYYGHSEEQLQGIRFSTLDQNLQISSDSLVRNNKNSYTILSGRYIRFAVKDKDHLIVAEEFFTKKSGLLMIRADDEQRLAFTHLQVINQYDYFLHKARLIPQQGILIPYVHKLEAGLIKVTVN